MNLFYSLQSLNNKNNENDKECKEVVEVVNEKRVHFQINEKMEKY